MSILRCSHCGTANREGSNFCNRCGTALHDQAQQFADEMSTSEISADDPMWTSSTDPANSASQSSVSAHGSESADSTSEATQFEGDSKRHRELSDRPATSADNHTAENRTDVAPSQQKRPTARQIGEQARPAVETGSIADEWPAEQISDADFIEPEQRSPSRRLVTGIQGLLDPIRLAGTDPDLPANMEPTFPPPLAIPADQLRRIRTLVTEDPVLIEHPQSPSFLPPTRFRLRWIIILLLLAVGIPILLGLESPAGEVRRWSGVAAAYTAINSLSAEATVQILWAYDPATAGELDLVMRPVAMDLIQQGVRVQIVSLLPTGLATARRLWTSTTEELTAANLLADRPERIDYWEGGFLAGGAPALALLARAPATALIGHRGQTPVELALRPADLAIVVAAHAEDVQQWLELVQPVTVKPVVAVTAASAAPLLQPYVASGQLSGLVSGFDGAASYHVLRSQRTSQSEMTRLRQQLVAQNWGHIALVTILVLGNLSALWLGQDGVSRSNGGTRRGETPYE